MGTWNVQWLAANEGGSRSVPAFDFLRTLPRAPRNQLLAIVDAVCTVGPERWRDYETHRPMKGEIDNLHEARDKHGETLYRLFLLWQRNAHRVVLIDGRTKPNSTKLADSGYEAIAKLAATAEGSPPPFATVDDFARAAFAAEDSPTP